MSLYLRGTDRLGRERWEVRVGWTDDTGVRHSKTAIVYGKRAAQAREAEMWVKARAGQLSSGHTTTLADYFKRWVEYREAQVASGELSARTLKDNRVKMGAALKRFGKLPLDKITRPAVKRWRSEMTGHTTTRHHQWTVFNQVMEEAKRDRLIAHNPCADIDAPPLRADEKRALTEAEYADLLKALAPDPSLHCAAVVMYHTGIRPGECLALRWADIDLGETPSLTVGATMADDGTVTVQDANTASTKNHNRSVPLSPEAVRSLKAQRASVAATRLEWAEKWADHDLVFPALDTGRGLKAGRGLRPATFARHWREALKRDYVSRKVKFPDAGNITPLDFTPHELRHTRLTEWRRRGLRMELVQYLAGHAPGSKVTSETYTAHISAEELGAVLG